LKRSKRRISISMKIMLSSVLLSAITCVIMGIAVYSRESSSLLEDTRYRVETMAKSLANGIDGGIHKDLYEKQIASDKYMEYSYYLEDFVDEDSFQYFYTVVKNGENDYKFFLTSDPPSADEFIGTECNATEKMKEAFEGKVTSEDAVVTDQWGSYISGYAPLYNDNNEVTAVVCVDYKATSLENQKHLLIKTIGLITLINWVIGWGLSYLFSRNLTKPILNFKEHIDTITNSDGDLTSQISVHTNDELEDMANSINKFISDMDTVIADTKKTSNSVSQVSDETSTFFQNNQEEMNNISETMQELSNSMDEIDNFMTELNKTIANAASSFQTISEKSMELSDYANRNQKHALTVTETSMKSRQDTIALIENYTNILNEKIEQAKSVYQINELTNSIIDISQQTNLLSLNASIEAARAGEQGKGFAIVASEIGALADSSAKTASQISTTSNVIIEAMEGLTSLSSQVIEYLNSSILNDYEKMTEIVQEYNTESQNVESSMKDIYLQTNELLKQIVIISDSFDSFTEVLSKNTSQVSNISDTTVRLNQQTLEISEKVSRNQGLITQLNETLGFFVTAEDNE